jgi:UDP-N-acetylmuramate dehydrogenase
MEFGYRTSILKRDHPPVVILSADLKFSHGDESIIRSKMEQFSILRRASQPPGASMGSMFKNPPADKAGRLLEAAGLKGKNIGNISISTQHANFFISSNPPGDAVTGNEAENVRELIEIAQQSVFDQFGIKLELEVEIIGEW